eukprot:GAHX01004094.1.p2 GENE.GAHX01004094.1~~GAHX01004094.1.p2  ORF type:complete len:99 (-),score=17.77 GAHX01004094.1:471-767(-)
MIISGIYIETIKEHTREEIILNGTPNLDAINVIFDSQDIISGKVFINPIDILTKIRTFLTKMRKLQDQLQGTENQNIISPGIFVKLNGKSTFSNVWTI